MPRESLFRHWNSCIFILMKSFENKVVVVTGGCKIRDLFYCFLLYFCVPMSSFADELAAQDSLILIVLLNGIRRYLMKIVRNRLP